MSMTIARHRLALGIVPRDALTTLRAGPVEVAVDRLIDPSYRPTSWPPASGRTTPDGFTRLSAQPSGVHALLRQTRFTNPVTLRVFDHHRRVVPRKLRIDVPVNAPTVVEPSFFPGAAYPIHKRATGIRGRVVAADKTPLRWARIEARRVVGAPRSGLRIGYAHGDDRGEFLLLVEPDLVTIGALPASADVELTVFVAPVPIPPSPDVRARDPYWDVPVEIIAPGATATNPVVAGVQPPPGFVAMAPVIVNLELGFLRSRVEVEVP